MPRRVQDIVSKDRRSIREVPADRADEEVKKPRGRAALSREETAEDDEDVEKVPIHKKSSGPALRRMPVTPPSASSGSSRSKRPKNRMKWALIALGIIIVVGIIGFIASSYYSRASFTIVPKVLPVSVNGTYVAQSGATGTALSYEVVTLKGTATTTVPATDGPQISTKASGKVQLSNSYSSTSVRLIAGTRVSNDAGLIYRLAGSVVIPGYTKPTGSIVPGIISVDITADQPGQTYNLAKADAGTLHIVAYNGSPKYDTIVAHPLTDITGGFVGTKKVVNQNAVGTSTANLKAAITKSLVTQLKSVIPDGYIYYDGNYATSFSAPNVGGDTHNVASVTISGNVYGIIFKKTDLINKFSNGQSESSFGDFGYTSQGLDALNVAIANLKDFTPDKKPSLVIHAKGDMKLVGNVPVEDIRKKLEGNSLASTQDVFKSYSPVIQSGSGELVPPWAKIPTDPTRITITVQNP